MLYQFNIQSKLADYKQIKYDIYHIVLWSVCTLGTSLKLFPNVFGQYYTVNQYFLYHSWAYLMALWGLG